MEPRFLRGRPPKQLGQPCFVLWEQQQYGRVVAVNLRVTHYTYKEYKETQYNLIKDNKVKKKYRENKNRGGSIFLPCSSKLSSIRCCV